MKLGLLTAPFSETPLNDVADWTAANGFTSIEIAAWTTSLNVASTSILPISCG